MSIRISATVVVFPEHVCSNFMPTLKHARECFFPVRHKQTCIYHNEHEVKLKMTQTLLPPEAVSKAEGSSSSKGKWTLLHLFPPLLFLPSTMSVGACI